MILLVGLSRSTLQVQHHLPTYLGNLTTRTTGALLLPPSTYKTAAQRCALLHEQLWSPSNSNFALGLNNALSYAAYTNDNDGSVQYWIHSPENDTRCNAITIKGIQVQKPCDSIQPVLC